MDKSLAHAFRLAQDLIATGHQWYICEALSQLYDRRQIRGWEYERARDIIQSRLGWALTVEDWLERNVAEAAWMLWRAKDPTSILRDYRVRWLDNLIEEFS